MKNLGKGAWILSILVAVTLGASAVAGAAGAGPMSGGDDDADEVAITGADAERAGRAAVAAVGGGTADRVERDDGGYDVDVKGAGGQITEVDVSADFKATGQDAGDSTDDARDTDDVAITGPVADRAGRVAERFAGSGSAVRVERDDDGGYDVDVRGANGPVTEVDVSAAFKAVPDDDAAEDRAEGDTDDDEGEEDDD